MLVPILFASAKVREERVARPIVVIEDAFCSGSPIRFSPAAIAFCEMRVVSISCNAMTVVFMFLFLFLFLFLLI